MLNIGVNCVVLDLADYKVEQKRIAKLEARVVALEKMVSIRKGYGDEPVVQLNLEPLRDVIVSRLGESNYSGKYVVNAEYELSTSVNWGILSQVEVSEEKEEE